MRLSRVWKVMGSNKHMLNLGETIVPSGLGCWCQIHMFTSHVYQSLARPLLRLCAQSIIISYFYWYLEGLLARGFVHGCVLF